MLPKAAPKVPDRLKMTYPFYPLQKRFYFCASESDTHIKIKDPVANAACTCTRLQCIPHPIEIANYRAFLLEPVMPLAYPYGSY